MINVIWYNLSPGNKVKAGVIIVFEKKRTLNLYINR